MNPSLFLAFAAAAESGLPVYREIVYLVIIVVLVILHTRELMNKK